DSFLRGKHSVFGWVLACAAAVCRNRFLAGISDWRAARIRQQKRFRKAFLVYHVRILNSNAMKMFSRFGFLFALVLFSLQVSAQATMPRKTATNPKRDGVARKFGKLVELRQGNE